MEVDAPELIPTSDKNQEKVRAGKLRRKRSEALDKVIKMMEDPDFDDKMHNLHGQNIKVWELIMKITELIGVTALYGDEAVDIPLQRLEGIEVFKKLFTDPDVESKKIRVTSFNKRVDPDPGDFLRVINSLSSRSAGEVVFDAGTRPQKPIKPRKSTRSETLRSKRQKRSGTKLEKKDPEIRERILEIFDIISTNQSFVRPIGTERMLREFPEVTQKSLDSFMLELEVEHNSHKKALKPRFGVREIARLYYKSTYKTNLTSQQERKLRQLVDELYPIWLEARNETNIDHDSI